MVTRLSCGFDEPSTIIFTFLLSETDSRIPQLSTFLGAFGADFQEGDDYDANQLDCSGYGGLA